jgi:UDP-glucose 4-epimerase
MTLILGTGNGTFIKELVDAIRHITGLDVPHGFVPARIGDPPSLYANPSKAKEILGWVAGRDMDEILISAWKWQLKLEVANYRL